MCIDTARSPTSNSAFILTFTDILVIITIVMITFVVLLALFLVFGSFGLY